MNDIKIDQMLLLKEVKKLGKRKAYLIRIPTDLEKWLWNQSESSGAPKSFIIQDILESYRHENKSWAPSKKPSKAK